MKVISKLQFDGKGFGEIRSYLSHLEMADPARKEEALKTTTVNIEACIERLCGWAFELGVKHGRRNPEDQP